MEGGGVQAFMNEEHEYAGLEDIDPEEEKFINEAFDEIYKKDPKLQTLLGSNVTTLSVQDKK